ncbi:MAG: hypothetical protein MI861_16535 [Pirellulales bacterium]|nr:hypothetical protein [Pirellulales bacterium]
MKGTHRLVNDAILEDDVLGQCKRRNEDDATFEALIKLDENDSVPVTFFAADPIEDTLAYVRAIVSVLSTNDARYRRYAAADVRQFFVDLNRGKPPASVAEFASRMRLSHIIVYYPTPEEGANLWYTCDGLMKSVK